MELIKHLIKYLLISSNLNIIKQNPKLKLKFNNIIYKMSKTLVIILSETRAHELTFNNFKKKSYRCFGMAQTQVRTLRPQ